MLQFTASPTAFAIFFRRFLFIWSETFVIPFQKVLSPLHRLSQIATSLGDRAKSVPRGRKRKRGKGRHKTVRQKEKERGCLVPQAKAPTWSSLATLTNAISCSRLRLRRRIIFPLRALLYITVSSFKHGAWFDSEIGERMVGTNRFRFLSHVILPVRLLQFTADGVFPFRMKWHARILRYAFNIYRDIVLWYPRCRIVVARLVKVAANNSK